MKLSLLTLIVILPFYCFAQFENRTLFTSGSTTFTSQRINQSYSNGTSGSTEISNFTFSPKVGIFLINKLLLGPNLSWSLSTNKPPSSNITSGETKSSGLLIGPFIRYYVFRGFYIHADYTWGKSKSKYFSYYSGVTTATTQTSNGFTTGVGYTVFLNQNKSVALDFSLAYRNRIQKNPPINPFSITRYDESGLVVGLGISGFLHLLTTK